LGDRIQQCTQKQPGPEKWQAASWNMITHI
ncbi:hypothetical protein RCH05_004225, partial [Janthinobacterium sp. CAN_S7]